MGFMLREYTIDPHEIHVMAYSHTPLGSWSQRVPRGVKITHIPTGLTAVCESHRSQHQNKNVALDDLVWQLIRRQYNIPEGWNPMDTAPKDVPILVLHQHDADPYTMDEADPKAALSSYGTHVEAMGKAEDGPQIAVWGGGDTEYDELSGKTVYWPDWWFVLESHFEIAVSPIAWLPIPGFTTRKVDDCPQCGRAGGLQSWVKPNRCDLCDDEESTDETP